MTEVQEVVGVGRLHITAESFPHKDHKNWRGCAILWESPVLRGKQWEGIAPSISATPVRLTDLPELLVPPLCTEASGLYSVLSEEASCRGLRHYQSRWGN